jgi:TPR repeat protein
MLSRRSSGAARLQEQGLAEAQLQLGDLYHAGRGVAEDLALAHTWYEKATAQGNPEDAAKLDRLGETRSRSAAWRFSGGSITRHPTLSLQKRTRSRALDRTIATCR